MRSERGRGGRGRESSCNRTELKESNYLNCEPSIFQTDGRARRSRFLSYTVIALMLLNIVMLNLLKKCKAEREVAFNGGAIRRARVPINNRCVAPTGTARRATPLPACGHFLVTAMWVGDSREEEQALCLVHFWSWVNSLFSLLALWGNTLILVYKGCMNLKTRGIPYYFQNF